VGRNVLFVTVDQWRGDCLSALGHPVLRTPALDEMAGTGVLFANHWANSTPCAPSRACLYTGTYLHHNRVLRNGTPLDLRFTNMARVARAAGYDPVLFGYTDTALDPRTVPPGDPRLNSYEGVLPGLRPVLHDPFEAGSLEWGRWLAAQGVDVPANPHDLYLPVAGFPGADEHGSTWAPARFGPEQSQTAFVVGELLRWLERHAAEPFFVHASFIRPHPPRRNPPGYHDLYDADDLPPATAGPTRESESRAHPLHRVLMHLQGLAAPDDERERRQIRATYHGAQREVDDQLGVLFAYLERTGLAGSTLVVVTSDHGEMAGDHWLLEKVGHWDQAFHVPLLVRDPDPAADPARGTVVGEFTESVDLLPTICQWLGLDVPDQADGWSLVPFLHGTGAPPHWRDAAHLEWHFSHPVTRAAESFFGLPMSHCSLAARRSASTKYVQFAADGDVLPPLLYDLGPDPGQLHDVAQEPAMAERAWEAARGLLQWRMRNDERTLSGHHLDAARGVVVARDDWR
jgi:arylsulfatase A-like enzyme